MSSCVNSSFNPSKEYSHDLAWLCLLGVDKSGTCGTSPACASLGKLWGAEQPGPSLGAGVRLRAVQEREEGSLAGSLPCC